MPPITNDQSAEPTTTKRAVLRAGVAAADDLEHEQQDQHGGDRLGHL